MIPVNLQRLCGVKIQCLNLWKILIKVNETYIQLYTLHAQFVVVLLNAHTKFCDNLLKLTLVQVFIMTCAFTCRFMNETEILTSVCWL